MKIPMKFKTKTPSLAIALGMALACCGLLPNAQATDVEGALPFGNNAEGVGVLTSLTTGAWNTGTGFEALHNESVGDLNTATGVRALFNDNGGTANTAYGVMALFGNTTGELNVATGAQALLNNIDGVSNTAAGTQALFGNTSGSGNCAVGQWALAFNAIGVTSNAFGYAALFNNDTTANNAFGFAALASNVTGPNNAAFGDLALVSNVVTAANCAFGNEALENNDSSAAGLANGNNAFGVQALFSNVDGETNNAFGTFALFFNDGGVWNNAFGFSALANNVSGNFNTAIGDSAGLNIDGSGNVCIGEGVVGEAGVNDSTYVRNVWFTSQPFIAGVHDVVTVRADGRLGFTQTFAPSSRRYKQDIKPMDQSSEVLFQLKPVTFRYNPDLDPAEGQHWGLVAEDVQKVNPDLVIRNREGQIAGVRYDDVNAMLLNEFLKEHKTVQQLKSTVERQEAIIAQQQKGMEVLTAQLKEQAAQIQKVSARLEVTQPAPQVVISTP
jgi:uncharacterized coiled-coil protein SlyX